MVIVEIDLTKEEIEIILEWYNCSQSEGSTSKKDDTLERKLSDYLDYLIGE